MERLYWWAALWYIRFQIEKAAIIQNFQKWIERES